MRSAMMVLVIIGISAAHGASAQHIGTSDPVRAATFAPNLHIVLDSARRLQSGAYVLDLAIGTGRALSSERPVTLQFAVWLPNGTQIQSLSPPTVHALGDGTLLQGVEQAMVGMKIGGRRRVIIPPSLGYGDQPTRPVPANSVLVIDVTFVAQVNGSN
jgi:FKBP-type peptidyl-prolyl cis-trans isomerase FkpA